MRNLYNLILQAEHKIRPYIRETPLEYSYPLSAHTGAEVYLKAENFQITGSFKARGALHKVLSLSREGQKIITASTGNHGLGVAHALSATGREGTIFLPFTASPAKVEAIKQRGVPISFYGDSGEITEAHARQQAEETNQIYISPYNDEEVIAGQGTIGVELIRQLKDIDAVYIAVGGGGLIAGVASYLKTVNQEIKIVACLPANAPVMYACVKAGRVIDVPEFPTLSDGTAGGLESNAITMEICRDLVDEYMLIPEEEILYGMQSVWEAHRWIIEGSAGVAVAAVLRSKENIKGKKIAILICGGNVSEAVLKQIVCP